jgi:hypothetical protein
MVKRGEKICVGSMVVSIIIMTLAASYGIAAGASGDPQARLIAEFLGWLWIISIVPICGYICAWSCDISQIRSSGTPKFREPPPPPKEPGIGID